MPKKNKKYFIYLLYALIISLLLKTTEWAFQWVQGFSPFNIYTGFELVGVVLLQLGFMIGITSVVSVFIYKTKFPMFLIPVFYYTIKEIFNMLITPLLFGITSFDIVTSSFSTKYILIELGFALFFSVIYTFAVKKFMKIK